MVRIVFNLPIKNSFDVKKSKLQSKENLDFWDRRVETHSRLVETAIRNTASIGQTSYDLSVEIQRLEGELERLKTSGTGLEDSLSVFDRSIYDHVSVVRSLDVELGQLNKRTRGVSQIIDEINTEIDTLNLNEEARRVFKSFSEICEDSNCRLFSLSSDSYSKNLLYLKDQIKDLQRNSSIDSERVAEIIASKNENEGAIKAIIERRNAVVDKSDISALVNAISEIKNRIFELQSMRSEIEKVEVLRSQNFEIIKSRDRAISEYQSFSTDRISIPELIRLKANLRQLFIAWLDELHTRNISRDITFKDDFVPLLGEETISQLKGSTRIRAVLAYHAALLELVANTKSRFQFLILDTPKQHEIHNDDLDRYLQSLKQLCINHNVQVVFSTTEYHYTGDEHDIEWNPQYPGIEQNMFLDAHILQKG